MRPAKITEKVENEICERISQGQTLREICREEGKPHYSQVYRWMNENKEFAQRIAHARDIGFDSIADECFDIADDSTNDYVVRMNENGDISQSLNTEHIQRSKLRIETRLKLLAKWSPKKYGDKIDVTSDNKPFPAPIIQILPPEESSDD